MPLYEYQCDACGHRFESIRRFSDPPLETCPTCGGAVRKLQSAPAIQFKGSGFYITDYARKDAPADKSDTSAKPAEKTDTPSAPATKNEPAPTKSEGGSQKSEDKGQKAEGRSQKAEGKSEKSS